MLPTMMVTFREGVEAFLIIAITALYLRNTGRPDLLKALRAGTVVAVAGSVLLGIVLAKIGALTPFWEGVLALIAMALVLGCTTHMMRHGKLMAQHIRERIGEHIGASAARSGGTAFWGVFLFTLLMIGREGVETATLLAALAGAANMRDLFTGGLIGIALAALLALAWARLGKRVNLTRFFQVTAVFMALFSIQLLIYAFHEFTEADAIPGLDNQWWHIATEPYGPEGQYGAWLSYSLVLMPLAFLIFTRLRDRTSRITGATPV